MSPPSSGPQLPFLNLFAASAVSACNAEVLACASQTAFTPPQAILLQYCCGHLLQALTLPLDTAKVRLQLQGGGGKYKWVITLRSRWDCLVVADVWAHSVFRGLLGTCVTIAREEGAGALWKGLEPGT